MTSSPNSMAARSKSTALPANSPSSRSASHGGPQRTLISQPPKRVLADETQPPHRRRDDTPLVVIATRTVALRAFRSGAISSPSPQPTLTNPPAPLASVEYGGVGGGDLRVGAGDRPSPL